MRFPTAVALAAILIPMFLTSAANAGEPAPGKMTTVECKANSAQRYSCYVPKAYSPKKAWPILYCFAPDAQGNVFVQRYQKVCEERGWIVVGSLNSKNGPWEPIQEAIDAMWADTEARFNLSGRRYASGFSGGARVSFGLDILKPGRIAGVIAIGAGLSSTNRGQLPRKELAVWLMCGETDFNLGELNALFPRFQKAGNPVRFEKFPGGHTLPQAPLMEQAVRFMDDLSADRQAERLAKAVEEARKLREDEPARAWLLLVDALAASPAVKEGGAAAEKLRKELERLPAVKTEVKALKAHEKAVAWMEKNAGRIEKFDAVRSQALKKLRDVVKRFPGTHGAKLAGELLAEIERD